MMLKIGNETIHGKIIAILWIGERYYSFEKDGCICLVPGVVAEREWKLEPHKCVRVVTA